MLFKPMGYRVRISLGGEVTRRLVFNACTLRQRLFKGSGWRYEFGSLKLTGYQNLLPTGVLGEKPIIGGFGLSQESTFSKFSFLLQETDRSLPILHIEDLDPPFNHLLGGYGPLDRS